MSRTVPAALVTALAQEQIEPYYAISVAFDSGTVRLWTGHGDRTIGGQTFTGAGELLSFGDMSEVSDLSAQNATVVLSGLSSTILSAALSEPYQGRQVTIYFGETSVSDYVEVFSGLADVMPIANDGTTVTVSLSIESRLTLLQRPNVRRYTPASHLARHTNDSFFRFVAALQDKEIAWGRQPEN